MGVTHPSPKVPPPIPKAASPVTCLRGLYTHIGHSYQREMRAGRVATWRLRCNQCLTNADPTLTVRLMTSSQYDMFFLKFCLYMHFRDVSDRLSAQLILDHYVVQFLSGHGDSRAKLFGFALVPGERCRCGKAETRLSEVRRSEGTPRWPWRFIVGQPFACALSHDACSYNGTQSVTNTYPLTLLAVMALG